MVFYKPAKNELSKESCYDICRFMIAEEYQRKGYGRKSLMKIFEKIKTFPYGIASAIYLSFKHENIVAKNLFLSVGFVETGKDDEDGDVIAKLIL